MAEKEAVILHVEINQKQDSSLSSSDIEREIKDFLYNQKEVKLDVIYSGVVLPEHISYFRICADYHDKYNLKLNENLVELRFYVYQNCPFSPQFEASDEDDNCDLPTSINWSLPNSEFEGLWESLVLEDEFKSLLINYVLTIMLYSKNNVSQNIIRWNGVILLHGPPGTGKTSLCKGLAQKLSIRLNSKYRNGLLVEINTSSLFSKWFSESPKLIFKMFKKIKQWLEYEENFVCILLDEVESLMYSRQISQKEPVDSIRAVNTVLAQLDMLQKYNNVLILATSNITEAIDIAFADRADLKLFLGYPTKWAVYEILRSCIEELIQCQLIHGGTNEIFEVNIVRKLNKTVHGGNLLAEVFENSNNLLTLSTLCEGLSGRTLRKLPFLTSTRFIDRPKPNIKDYLAAMEKVILNQKNDNSKFRFEQPFNSNKENNNINSSKNIFCLK